VPFVWDEYRRDIKRLMLRANRSRADASLISIALQDAMRQAEQLRLRAAQLGDWESSRQPGQDAKARPRLQLPPGHGEHDAPVHAPDREVRERGRVSRKRERPPYTFH
jgi:hypothetical protein